MAKPNLTENERELLAALCDEMEGRGVGAAAELREPVWVARRLVGLLESGRVKRLPSAALDDLLLGLAEALVIVRVEIRLRAWKEDQARAAGRMVHRGKDTGPEVFGHTRRS